MVCVYVWNCIDYDYKRKERDVMPENIWLYGFDGFEGTKTVGFVIARSSTEAVDKVWDMYNDFATDYNLSDLVVWKPEEDDNYREDYPDVMEIVY